MVRDRREIGTSVRSPNGAEMLTAPQQPTRALNRKARLSDNVAPKEPSPIRHQRSLRCSGGLSADVVHRQCLQRLHSYAPPAQAGPSR